jgi:hypothetical protein
MQKLAMATDSTMVHTNLFKKYALFGLIAIFSVVIALCIHENRDRERRRHSDRSMYLWSSAFNTYTIDYIETYLTTNKISTALVSSSNKTAFNQLAKRLSAKGVQTELLLGSNSVLTNTNQVAYFDNLFTGIDTKNITALHLDVEPHTLSDYQTRKNTI